MAPRLQQLRGEAGTSIVEVVVAAVILIIAAGAVASLVDAAQRDSGQQRIQAVATDLGQAQMEELRTLRFDDLIDLDDTQDVAAGEIRFTVRRRSDWAMTAEPGAVGCSTNSRNPEALRVTTTVTWPSMKRRPVVLESLVAAPTGAGARRGGFTVQVGDREGFGVSGLAITMTGPATMTGTTDGSGCVRFNDLPAGDYSVTGGRGGWLQPDGATSLQRDVTVVTGTTATTSFEYDAGGRAAVRFYRANDASKTALVAVPAARFTGGSADVLVAASPGPTATDFTSPLLFPTVAQYSVKADTCTSVLPAGGATVPQGATSAVQLLPVPVLQARVRDLQKGSGTVTLRAASACGTLFVGSPVVREGSEDIVTVALPGGTLPYVCAVQYVDANPDRWYWERRAVGFTLDQPIESHPNLSMRNAPFVTTSTNDPLVCAS